LKLYARTPSASAAVVVVLAVAVACVGAFVSLYVDQVLRPHAGFEQSGRIVTILRNNGSETGGLPLDLVECIAAESTTRPVPITWRLPSGRNAPG
jgi:hypothetical protein